MLVSDLRESLQGVEETSLETTFASVAVEEDASALRIDTGTHVGVREFPFDAQAERALAKYLGVSTSYLAKCPPDLKAYNLNYHLNAKPGIGLTAEILGDKLVSFHRPGLPVLGIHPVADVIVDAMHPNDEVIDLRRDETSFHVDIVTDKTVEVESNDDIPDRTRGDRQIGDITRGGVRVLSSPTEVKAPSVVPYFYRLWCTNGCSSPVDEGAISLRGNTVEEVLQEMSDTMSRIRGELDDKLDAFAEMAARRVPGSPTRFARQIGSEYGIPARVMTRVLDRIEQLPEDGTTLYDVQQVFTSVANGDLPYRTMMRLQALGGDMALDTEHVLHRCNTCERPLPE